MKKSNAKQKSKSGHPRKIYIVVDASVLRSAGLQSKHRTSVLCRESLMAIIASNIRCQFDDILYSEWKRNSSRFSSTWLASMKSKSRLYWIKTKPISTINVAINSILLKSQRNAAIKDKHLVECALGQDLNGKRILSRDNKARAIYHDRIPKANELRYIYWADPIIKGCQMWIKDSCRFAAKWSWISLNNPILEDRTE